MTPQSLATCRPARARPAGFTLIELLVVIAIIAILAALLFPVFSAARASALSTTCQSNLQQLGNAFTLYLQDWDETFPNSWRGEASPYGTLTHSWWDQEIDSYVKSDGVFACPANPVDSWSVHQPFNSAGVKTRRVNYAMNNQLLGCPALPGPFPYQGTPTDPAQLSEVQATSLTILLAEKMLDNKGHEPAPANEPGNQSEEVDVWYHLTEPGLDPPMDWDTTWGVPRALHRGGSNYLFVDGHVKFLDIRATFQAQTGVPIPMTGAAGAPVQGGPAGPNGPATSVGQVPMPPGAAGAGTGASAGQTLQSGPTNLWSLKK